MSEEISKWVFLSLLLCCMKKRNPSESQDVSENLNKNLTKEFLLVLKLRSDEVARDAF
jgi:hypothetical protein